VNLHGFSLVKRGITSPFFSRTSLLPKRLDFVHTPAPSLPILSQRSPSSPVPPGGGPSTGLLFFSRFDGAPFFLFVLSSPPFFFHSFFSGTYLFRQGCLPVVTIFLASVAKSQSTFLPFSSRICQAVFCFFPGHVTFSFPRKPSCHMARFPFFRQRRPASGAAIVGQSTKYFPPAPCKSFSAPVGFSLSPYRHWFCLSTLSRVQILFPQAFFWFAREP